MQTEAEKLINDIREAAADIRDFTNGFDLAAYRSDARTRAAVERKFEIVGEACGRLRDRCPEAFSNISAAPQIIGFRNRLIHGYDGVDDGLVWDVIQQKLPGLIAEIEAL